MNPSAHAQCWIVAYPLTCIAFGDVPCVRGVHFRKAIVWMHFALCNHGISYCVATEKHCASTRVADEAPGEYFGRWAANQLVTPISASC
jgi:hypothetical protein